MITISYQGTVTRKAWSPPAAAYSRPSITQPINLEYKLIKHKNETKYNPIHFALKFGTKQRNHAYLAWQLVVEHTSRKFYSFSP